MPHVGAPPFQTSCLGKGEPDVDGHDEEGGETYIDIGGEHEDECQKGAGQHGQEVDEDVLHCGGERTDTLVDAGLQAACFIA